MTRGSQIPAHPLPSESRVGQTGQIASAADIGTLYRDDERSLEEKYGKLIAPRFEVEISDTNDEVIWSAESMIQRGSYDLNGIIVNDVQWEQDIEGAAVIEITINNPDLTLQDSRLFAEGNNIDLWMGYDGRPALYMGRGIIVEIEPEFPTDTIPVIKIKAYDKSYFMMEEEKAEIVPEGSEWWERNRERAIARHPLRETITRNNAFPGQEIDEEWLADAERFNTALGEDFIPGINLTDALDAGIDPSVTVVEQETVSIRELQEATGLDPEAIQQMLPQESRSGWRQQRFGRRRRNAGHVWRGKTDSEIAAAIFLSYGIDPYVEATRERTRASRGTAPGNPNLGERSGHPALQYDYTAEDWQDLPAAGFWQESAADEEAVRRHEERERYEAISRASEADAQDMQERYVYPTNVFHGYVLERQVDFPGMGFWAQTFADDEPIEPFIPITNTPSRAPSQARMREVTQKAGTTDWEFIKKLAERHGFIVFVFFHIESRRWIGYWGPESNVPQFREYRFAYNDGDVSTLGTVRPNMSLRGQATEIDLLYVDPVSRKTNRLRVSLENINPVSPAFNEITGSEQIQEPVGNGPEVVLTIHGQRVRTHANRRFTSAEDARNWIIAFWYRHAQEFLFIEGDTIIGLPEMRAREKHQFDGLGRFSGRFFVTMTRHGMRPGQVYKTNFVARKFIDFSGEDELGENLVVLDQEDMGEPAPDESSMTLEL